MSAKRKNGRSRNKLLTGILLIALAVCLIIFLSEGGTIAEFFGIQGESKPMFAPVSGQLQINYIDVEQADCILIKAPSGKTMLIDAGEKETQKELTEEIRSQGVNTIDILVATHPHADHIGGMQYIVEQFEIGSVYMPKNEHATKTFSNLVDSIADKGLKIHTAKAGGVLDLGPDVTVDILAPVRDDYSNTNDYSVVIRLVFGETAFLFTGDAEHTAEEDILETGAVVQATVLKAGHHGSSTSTSEAFLRAVKPDYCVISVGAGNKYNHPEQETLDRLAEYGIEVYRTDLMGTITVQSDGKEVTFSTEKAV